MNRLKGIIISRKGVFESSGGIDSNILDEQKMLIKYLVSREIKPILISDIAWKFPIAEAAGIPYQKYLSDACETDLVYYQEGIDIGSKRRTESMKKILADQNLKSSEVVYVGNTRDDMMAATNGGLMFMNATWYETNSPHGFTFCSPKDFCRFIDCCCVIPKDWFWKLEQDDLRVYSIAPLAEVSPRYPEGVHYSRDAKLAVKHNSGQIRFWGMLIAARIHLSGIGAEASYVVPYPRSSAQSETTILMNSVRIISLTLRDQYLHDFICRHRDAPKSQYLRRSSLKPRIENQLNTIHLISNPTKPGIKQERYIRRPKTHGKTILVVDDICTEGYSFEAARAFLEATGARVVMMSLLKTPGRDYHEIKSLNLPIENPFQAYTYQGHVSQPHLFNESIANDLASKQINEAYTKYHSWNWPAEI